MSNQVRQSDRGIKDTLSCNSFSLVQAIPRTHAPYSPDISPCAYRLFRSLELYRRKHTFETREGVPLVLSQFFDSKPLSFFMSGIHKLEAIWRDVVDLKGAYVE